MHGNDQAENEIRVCRDAEGIQRSFGRLLLQTLAGAALGCASIPLVAVLINPMLPVLLVLRPLLGIHLVVSGLVAASVTATAAQLARQSGEWAVLVAALLAFVLFAVPVGLFVWYHSTTLR